MPDSKGDTNYNPPNTKPEDKLTPEMVYRETMAVKELMVIQFQSISKAIDVAHEDMVRVPTDVQKAVGALKELVFQKIDHRQELHNERFEHINKLFELIEETRKEQKKDNQIAMENAIAAVKEAGDKLNQSNTTAINKSEVAIAEQIKQIMIQMQTIAHSLDEKITDVKDKVTKYEGSGEGKKSTQAAMYALVLAIVAVMGLIFTALGFAINYMTK